jgi:hypothetical protein
MSPSAHAVSLLSGLMSQSERQRSSMSRRSWRSSSVAGRAKNHRCGFRRQAWLEHQRVRDHLVVVLGRCVRRCRDPSAVSGRGPRETSTRPRLQCETR